MEADRERHGLGPAAAAGRDQPVLARQLAAVAGEVQPALVEQAVAPGIAVMARLYSAAGGLVADQLDRAHPFAERSVLMDRGRVAVAKRKRRMGGGGAQRMD